MAEDNNFDQMTIDQAFPGVYYGKEKNTKIVFNLMSNLNPTNH